MWICFNVHCSPANKCVGMLITWLHGKNIYVERTVQWPQWKTFPWNEWQRFLKGIYFVCCSQKEKKNTLQRNDRTLFDRLKYYSNHCTCKLVNTLNNTYSKIQKRTKEGFRNTKKQHPHLHYFHSAFVKFRIVATFADAAVAFDVREL